MTPVRIKEWQIVEQVPETGIEPRFSVVIADPEISARPLLLGLPYTGITDTTITPESHDLYLEIELPISQDRRTLKNAIHFRKKNLTDAGGEAEKSQFPNSPITVTFADTVNEKRKALIDDDSGVSITVSDKTTAMGRPGREMLVGEKGVTMLSGSPRILSLPEEDIFFFKQKGIGQLAPQCFVPPFCFPEYMPNFEFVSQVANVVSIFKAISNLTKAA